MEPLLWNPKKFRTTVFDVGMHDGADTAFYLHQGCAVLAIEADPTLAAAGSDRFQNSIQNGQLHVLNVGIAQQTSTAAFWICDDHTPWNSFDVRIASRNGSRCHPINVPTWRFEDVLDRFGIPEYLKIDIEGHDWLCVQALGQNRLPRFISVESECVGDGETLSEDESLRMLNLLRDAGYSRFKLVAPEDFRTITYPDRLRFVRRLLDSAAYGKLSRFGLGLLARPFTVRRRLERLNGTYEFKDGSSGPWGKGLLGKWSSYEDARRTYLGLRNEYFERRLGETYAFWFDWHATA